MFFMFVVSVNLYNPEWITYGQHLLLNGKELPEHPKKNFFCVCG